MYRPTDNQYIGWYIDQHVVNVSTDWYIGSVSTSLSADSGCPIVSQHVDWLANDILLKTSLILVYDILTTFVMVFSGKKKP